MTLTPRESTWSFSENYLKTIKTLLWSRLQYETYFTEKLLDCFATGTIPVYLGAPDIGKYFNKDGIIDLTDEFYISDELYHSKMEAIKDNLERVKNIEVLEDFIYLNYLQ